ncbi:NACHT domain-containing protein [Cryptosporangium minutisporangium]|uniref:NACHT domain-containing protein n=1 Tax=Cryptosporangium minutisporangium TaxID=113569 RepID=A0ABP6SSG6_9ACTN
MTRPDWGRLAATAALTVAAGVAINQVLDGDGIKWVWLLFAVAVAMVGGYLTWPQNLRAEQSNAQARPADQAETLKALAAAVQVVWEPELRRRRLHHPHPLPTAWNTLGPPLSDHWANIRSDGREESLDLDGVVDRDHPDALHRIVRDTRLRGRIVVLGEPGSGKTALMLRAVVRLIDERAATDRVPVLLRLSTWDPDQQSLDQWIAARLEVDYGQRARIPRRLLLPLLDGLDEMPTARRPRALAAISNTFDPDAPLLLTSRTREFCEALGVARPRPLAAAAIVELTPLPAALVRRYLQHTGHHGVAWHQLFRRDAENGGHLAAALDQPLWVDLAREAYNRPSQAGDELAELLTLPNREAVHARLLDRLVPALYVDPSSNPSDGDRWHRTHAERWLRFLAADMCARRTQDIAWWELATAVPRFVRACYLLTVGIAGGLAVGLVLGLATNSLTAVVLGLCVGLVGGILSWRRTVPQPSRHRLRWRRTHRRLPVRVLAGLAEALPAGIAGGLAIGLAAGIAGGFHIGAMAGLVYGLMATAGIGLVGEFTTLSREDDAERPVVLAPADLLRSDRRRHLSMGMVGGLLGALVLGVPLGIWVEPTVGLTAGLAYAVAGPLVSALGRSGWGWLQMARLWWSGRQELPWRLMAFLADAHRRGVLQQAGAVYQFRHALLRDRLASTEPTSEASADQEHYRPAPAEPA